MTKIDFSLLRSEIAAAARCAFATVLKNHPDEQFYAFALYSDDAAMSVVPAANSEEALRRKAQNEKQDEGSPAPDAPPVESSGEWARWFTGEWAYEAEGGEHFDRVDDLLNAADNCADADFPAFRINLYETMIEALGELDAQGFFGTGEQREAVTLFCSISDSDDAEQLENRSAEKLNPAIVYEKFSDRYN